MSNKFDFDSVARKWYKGYEYCKIKELLTAYLKSRQKKIKSIELEIEEIIDGDIEHDEGGTLSNSVTSYDKIKLNSLNQIEPINIEYEN